MQTGSIAANKVLRIHPADNVLVALTDLRKGDEVNSAEETIVLRSDVPAKHKFAIRDLLPGDRIVMYGNLVGKATQTIASGEAISVRNTRHDAAVVSGKVRQYSWEKPGVSQWQSKTFQGFRRSDGQVGTRNYWIVLPLVFCENRNIDAMREAFTQELG